MDADDNSPDTGGSRLSFPADKGVIEVSTQLNEDSSCIEEELRKIGVEFNGWVKCLKIGDVRLIAPSFHPGPMRGVGGSRMVERIMERFEKSIFLHTAVEHDLNPVDEEGVDKIVSSVSCSDIRNLPVEKPFELEGDRYLVRVFPFGDCRLIFLIGKDSSDDLPFWLNSLAGEKCILVECHSAYDRKFRSSSVIDEVRELIERAKNVRTERSSLRYAFKSKKVEEGNICGYICALALDYGEERHLILMLDGNNVLKEFRKEIEEMLADHGFKATVISTDNHSKTGYAKVGYRPIGYDPEDRCAVMEFVDEFLRDAEFRDCDDVCFGYSEVKVKVMGEKFFSAAEEAVRKFSTKSILLFFLIQIAQVAIQLLNIY